MTTAKFVERHNGPRKSDLPAMLEKIGVKSVKELIDQTIPQTIRLKEELVLDNPMSEYEFFNHIKKVASKNELYKTYIGMGYYNTATPAVILRNILENPSWYTSYTPYQAEISQGRLEALLNFQTVVIELTKMDIANASLLDEATAAAEAMIMMYNSRSRQMQKDGINKIFVDSNIFPQTLDVLNTRALPLEIEIEIGDFRNFNCDGKFFGILVQYPAGDGKVENYSELVEKAHKCECMVAVAADLLSLAILTPPGEWDADIVLGSTQRFGVPMGYGGPHAAFFATKDKFKRTMPGRIIGVSKDVYGNRALRMALQTREQHIKREKATSNICTAQALLATMAGMYAVYHGSCGLKNIAKEIHAKTGKLSEDLKSLGYKQENENFFDTLKIAISDDIKTEWLKGLALKEEINFRYYGTGEIGISVDETTTLKDLNKILKVFIRAKKAKKIKIENFDEKIYFDNKFERKSDFLKLDTFQKYHSETEMMRYIKKLERKDISLTHSMISLGSCTMKLNAAVEMLPVSFPEFGGLHPFVPKKQAKGYHFMFDELRKDLSIITGFDDVSLQPNSGAAGEYAGLMVIKAYHESRGEGHRKIVLIPSSAHGTNPASAAMAGLDIIVVKCDAKGNIDIADLKEKAEANKANLSAFMVTYPSTHGVFESAIIDMCQIIHDNGGQVYMDGANMNAQIGFTSPATIGADVCHLNLHKTFAIPHGGGGPGVGPIAVAKHLVYFLPSHSVIDNNRQGITAVSAAPYGSASVLPISYGYIKMMGAEGLKNVTEMAILNANYLASSLKDYFDILYTGEKGRVAHEMILDCHKFKDYGITETDIAKRLMDYGFHAPTLYFPVHGTLMVEPTESESKEELDRFIEAMISIYNEIMEIKNGIADKEDNVLKNAPHSEREIVTDEWRHKYGKVKAAYPLEWIRENKFWIPVSRIDDAFGDRNLFCTCAPVENYK
jgi:glycine dehydrogenase